MRDMRGAFAQYVTVSAGNALRIPDSLTTRVAALAEPTAIAIHAVELADVRPEDRVLVTGGGPVGLLIVAVLRARGVTDITVSEPVAARRQQALAVGAARTGAPRQPGGPGAGQHRLRAPMPWPSSARATPAPADGLWPNWTSPAPWCSSVPGPNRYR